MRDEAGLGEEASDSMAFPDYIKFYVNAFANTTLDISQQKSQGLPKDWGQFSVRAKQQQFREQKRP